jgi:hypothetical protein
MSDDFRGHLARDMAPYVCIFGNCEMPDAMFVTTDELNKHILKHHGVQRWICNYCAPNLQEGQLMVFDTAKDWKDHVAESHFPTMPASRLDVFSEMNMSVMVGPIPCPLCDFYTTTVQPELEQHIREHMHSFALRSLPWGIGDDRKDSDAAGFNAKSDLSFSNQEMDVDYLGVSPFDRFPLGTEISHLRLQDEIRNFMKIGRNPWENLPEGTQLYLHQVIESSRSVNYGQKPTEPYNDALMRIYCLLFQLGELVNPSVSSEADDSYTVPKDVVAQIRDYLKIELELFLEVSYNTPLDVTNHESDHGRSSDIGNDGTLIVEEPDTKSMEVQPLMDTESASYVTEKAQILETLSPSGAGSNEIFFKQGTQKCKYCDEISSYFILSSPETPLKTRYSTIMGQLPA